MWVSRISSLGAQAIKKLTQGSLGQAAYTPRSSYFHACACRGVQSSLRPLQMQQYLCTAAATDSGKGENKDKKTINVTFVETDGSEKHVEVPVGTNILEAAHSNDIELEGACEGSCACSTCHVIVMDMEYYNRLPDPSDEENDMLDLAFGLTETSRLGCQVEATPDIDGIRLALPVATRNFAVDGYKPKPH
ncbi:uncharacterized protein LOC141622698 isoform X2 [Silene latifolia]|uniref:uncharacterized protein LOC141622698 isoform X2 n=1 Tax=Silene latifolia TaxID=37657 RepID=UPI003D7745E6